jgi:hypothetical protein
MIEINFHEKLNANANADVESKNIAAKRIPFPTACGTVNSVYGDLEGHPIMNCPEKGEFQLHHEGEPDDQATSVIVCETHLQDGVEFLETVADEHDQDWSEADEKL